MKLSVHLLQAISIGIAVCAVSSSCQQEEASSGQMKKEEEVRFGGKTESSPDKSAELKENARKEKEKIEFYKNCPNCGMG